MKFQAVGITIDLMIDNSMSAFMDLKDRLKPGSDERDELLEIISNSSKLQDAATRRNFLINSGLEDFISELNLSANPSDFADDVVIKLLNAERLYLLLKSLLKRDKLLSPENKRFVTGILGEDQSEGKEGINKLKEEVKKEEESKSRQMPSTISTSKKLDKQILVKYGLREEGQIPNIIKMVDEKQRQGVFSIFLEGNRKITKEYIVSRIILELREQQGVEINVQPMNEYCAASEFNECMERIKKQLEDKKPQVRSNQCCIFLLSFSNYHSSKIVESCFDVFLKNEAIQKLEEEKDRCFMFIWIFEKSQFSKTELRKLERQVSNFSVCKIVLDSFKNVIRTQFRAAELDERIDECFGVLDGIKGEFFPTYEYMDETFVNPPPTIY